ncbi:MAG: DNA-formamidopyrimidine glycosylase family protein [Myxococcota bacterium]
MPELPDIELYRHALRQRVVGHPFEKARLASPFLLRTVDPPLAEFEGRVLEDVRRLGKRLVFAFEGELFWVLHLMIAGRLQWKKKGAKPPGRVGLAAFDWPDGTLILTEASKKKRARLHTERGEEAVAAHDPGGIEPLEIDFATFDAALTRENHTVKRALTDPRVFSGIGNAYSDEILFGAKLPPHRWTRKLKEDERRRLYDATQALLAEWRDRLVAEVGDDWPGKVTAFRPDMKVHGKYKEPCAVCGEPIQRIAYADNETNYCAVCQNEGKLLADRGLSRLLKGDWPKSLDALEQMKRERKG